MLLVITAALVLVTAVVAAPPAQATYCYEDNLLRAFQHTPTPASQYCITATGSPTFLKATTYPATRLSSACSCFSRFPTEGVAATSTTTTSTSTTTTSTSTTTTSATATATCGINLVLNGDFPNPQYAPFTESSTGNAEPQFNSGCGIDPFCPLIIVNGGGGSETLTQTIATFPGETYTLSFYYNNFGASPGSSLSCSVNVPGSQPVAANLNTVTGVNFVQASGTFTAVGASTVLTCVGTTTGNIASNIEAIHIEC